MQIRTDAHTVIVTVDADPGSMASIREHAASGLEAFAAFDGFLGGALHVSADGRRLVQFLQWHDEATYMACRNDTGWDDLESTRCFMELVNTGRALVDERAYGVLAVR
jgi:quinol monooxygenase YgiN